jgi:hypothetical protein
MDILTGLTAISQTLAITKDLREIDDKIVVAEFKLRIAEMVDRLLEAKQSLIEAQEREVSLRNEILKLKGNVAKRSTMTDENGIIYVVASDGTKIGEPYCNLCHVKEDKLYRMRRHLATVGQGSHFKCDNCRTTVVTGPPSPLNILHG